MKPNGEPTEEMIAALQKLNAEPALPSPTEELRARLAEAVKNPDMAAARLENYLNSKRKN